MRRYQPSMVLCSTGSRMSISTARAHGTGRSSLVVGPDRRRTDKKPMGKQQLRAIVMLAIVGLACAPRLARAQAIFKVGSFTKYNVNASCPMMCKNDVPHGLGVTPQALILWTDGSVTENGAATATYWWAFGVTDGTTSRSVGAVSRNGQTTSNANRRSAAVVLTIPTYGSQLTAEATFQAT